MVRQNALKIRSWADVFWVGKWRDHSGVDLPYIVMTRYIV